MTKSWSKQPFLFYSAVVVDAINIVSLWFAILSHNSIINCCANKVAVSPYVEYTLADSGGIIIILRNL